MIISGPFFHSTLLSEYGQWYGKRLRSFFFIKLLVRYLYHFVWIDSDAEHVAAAYDHSRDWTMQLIREKKIYH